MCPVIVDSILISIGFNSWRRQKCFFPPAGPVWLRSPPELKRSIREAVSSPASSAEVKSKWSCTFFLLPLHSFDRTDCTFMRVSNPNLSGVVLQSSTTPDRFGDRRTQDDKVQPHRKKLGVACCESHETSSCELVLARH